MKRKPNQNNDEPNESKQFDIYFGLLSIFSLNAAIVQEVLEDFEKEFKETNSYTNILFVYRIFAITLLVFFICAFVFRNKKAFKKLKNYIDKHTYMAGTEKAINCSTTLSVIAFSIEVFFKIIDIAFGIKVIVISLLCFGNILGSIILTKQKRRRRNKSTHLNVKPR